MRIAAVSNDLLIAPPCVAWLPSYAEALGAGWSPNNLRDVSREQLAAIARDPDAFLAGLAAQSGTVTLPDGRAVPKLPNRVRWLWDGSFCGVIGLRWQKGTEALPPHVTGHVGYAVVPWKRGRGYATVALRAILPIARGIGLGRIEVTADSTNVASRRVIERCGGVLRGERGEGHAPDSRLLVYVVDTDTAASPTTADAS